MDGTMNRVDFYCRGNIEACLLEAKTHAACTREKIHSDRSAHAKLRSLLLKL